MGSDISPKKTHRHRNPKAGNIFWPLDGVKGIGLAKPTGWLPASSWAGPLPGKEEIQSAFKKAPSPMGPNGTEMMALRPSVRKMT